MNSYKYLEENFGIPENVSEMVSDAEKTLDFSRAEKIAEYNQFKVLKAFADNKVSDSHFIHTTGYGYDDAGRETLDRVYAQVFDAEDALVRHNFISGTHTISTALFAVLRPDDTLVSVTGKPYDTLEEVIGISGESGGGSLADFGVKYKQIELLDGGMPDMDKIESTMKAERPRAALIQRSKGYGDRPTFSPEFIGGIVKKIKAVSPDTVCIVDNCYGEFVDIHEPTYYGADMIAGSLIKNPGGGLAESGGYIAGKSEYINLAANRLTSVGIGRECGASLGFNKQMYQGLFMAPHTVLQAVKSAMLCSAVFDRLGYEVSPKPDEERFDIIQAVKFETEKPLIAFCQGIQKGAPVDSFVCPEPWDMPGYQDQVIMAAGAFVQGASIELSADAPIKEPFIAYMQGGLTYESAKLGIVNALKNVLDIQKNLD